MKTLPLAAAIAAISLGGCTWLYGDQGTGEQSSGRQSSAQQSSQELQPAASPQLVRSVQQQLNAKGVKAGPVDGIWGPRTQQAVREFQKKQGLEASGQLNAETLAALGVQEQSASAGASDNAASAGGSSSAGRSNRLLPSFTDADANKDGSVSRQEFDAAFKRAR